MKWGSAISPRAIDWGLLFVRIPVGLTFIYHGSQKVFGGIPGFADYLAQLQIPAPSFFAYVVALVEFLGGLCVLLGFLTPVLSAFLIVDLLVAIATVHLPSGLDFTKGGFEPHLAWIGILICLILAGPGRYSIDRFIGARASTKPSPSL